MYALCWGRELLTSLVRMGVASAFRSGGVIKPNHSRSLGGGGTHVQTVPCSEWMSTWIRRCILHGHPHPDGKRSHPSLSTSDSFALHVQSFLAV